MHVFHWHYLPGLSVVVVPTLPSKSLGIISMFDYRLDRSATSIKKSLIVHSDHFYKADNVSDGTGG